MPPRTTFPVRPRTERCASSRPSEVIPVARALRLAMTVGRIAQRAFLDTAIVARGDLAPGGQGIVELAENLTIPSVAVGVILFHRLAREEIIVVEIAQRQRLEDVVIAVLGVLQFRFVAAM